MFIHLVEDPRVQTPPAFAESRLGVWRALPRCGVPLEWSPAMPGPNANPPVPLVALAGWLVPGSGYWLLGHRKRAIVIGVCVIILFALGILVAGIAVVEAPSVSGPGNVVGRILQKPWFLGQVMTGPMGLISAWIGQGVADDYPVAKSRLGEIGTLYTAVAGMLNLLAIIDASYRASDK